MNAPVAVSNKILPVFNSYLWLPANMLDMLYVCVLTCSEFRRDGHETLKTETRPRPLLTETRPRHWSHQPRRDPRWDVSRSEDVTETLK